MAITQIGTALSGTFTQDGWSGSNSLTGTVTNQTVVVALVYADLPDCTRTMTGVVSSDQWRGTAQTFQCTGSVRIGQPNEQPRNFIRTR
jgi:hypothetical protein